MGYSLTLENEDANEDENDLAYTSQGWSPCLDPESETDFESWRADRHDGVNPETVSGHLRSEGGFVPVHAVFDLPVFPQLGNPVARTHPLGLHRTSPLLPLWLTSTTRIPVSVRFTKYSMGWPSTLASAYHSISPHFPDRFTQLVEP